MLKIRRLVREILNVLREDAGVAFLKDYGNTLPEDKVIEGTNREGNKVLITSIGSLYEYYKTNPHTGVTSRYEDCISTFEGYKFKEVYVGTYKDWEKSVKVIKTPAALNKELQHEVFVYNINNEELKLKLSRYSVNTYEVGEAEKWLIGKNPDQIIAAYVKYLFEDIAKCLITDIALVESGVNFHGKPYRTYSVSYLRTPHTDESKLEIAKRTTGYIR